jgi:hypothetical protein
MFINICTYIYIYTNICIHIYTFIQIYVQIYIYMYIYIYIHTHIYIHKGEEDWDDDDSGEDSIPSYNSENNKKHVNIPPKSTVSKVKVPVDNNNMNVNRKSFPRKPPDLPYEYKDQKNGPGNRNDREEKVTTENELKNSLYYSKEPCAYIYIYMYIHIYIYICICINICW